MTPLADKIKSLKETLNGVYVKPSVEKVNSFCSALWTTPHALDYLNITRGINKETIENFKLGYDSEKDAISIPVYKRGELINIRYRYINPEGKNKYTQEKGCEVWIYNEDGIAKGQSKGGVLITEGEFDLMSCWQAGFKNVISPASGKDSYGVWLELLDTIPKVYIAYDNDKPGKKASIELAERVGSEKSFEVLYPEGIKDANEYFKDYTADDYKNLIRNARPYYKYKFSTVQDIIGSMREKNDVFLKLKTIPFVEFEEDWMIILSGQSNIGKCHGKGTEILMHDGSIKKVEDVVVGDTLMGPDSMPRKVLSLARGIDDMYSVHERNESYVVNSSHILSLSRLKHARNGEKKEYKIEISVENFLKKSDSYRFSSRGWKTGVSFKEKSIEIDPYFLGVWLGDGTSSTSQITTKDNEIIDYVNNYCFSLGLNVLKRNQKNNKSITLNISGNGRTVGSNHIINMFRKYNLLNNKHIPFDFKVNSEHNRLQLLAGLIDTDGYLGKTKRGETYEIIQKSKQLSNDIVYLARSLGFRAVITEVNKGIASTGFVGKYYRINITGDLKRIPVRIGYKKSTFSNKKKYLTSKIEIKSIGRGDYYGFTLDGDGLYLLSSFTVTHNTTMAMNVANELVNKGIPTLILPFERGIKSVGKRFIQVRNNKTQDEFVSFSDEEWDKLLRDTVELPLYFSMPHNDEIKEIVTRAKRIFNTKVVIVDHLNYLVRKSDNNENQETSRMLQEFKSLAQEHNIIFIIIHHIKKPEGIGTVARKPKMEDLKGSSSIYQDPEAVVMLSAPETGKIEIDIVKNKGPMGSKIFDFNLATGLIGEEAPLQSPLDDF